jgi:hypothetical protein
VAGCSEVGIAARLCYDLTLNGYADWYLPSINELQQLFYNRAAINVAAIANGGAGFSTSAYWSSTQTDSAKAFAFNFLTTVAYSSYYYTKFQNMSVRAVRAF